MIAAYRASGFWPQIWHVCLSLLKRGRLKSFPPRGFVGRGSGSYRGSDLRDFKLASIHLRPDHSIRGVRLWRLTYEWEICPPPRRRTSGDFWGRFGKR